MSREFVLQQLQQAGDEPCVLPIDRIQEAGLVVGDIPYGVDLVPVSVRESPLRGTSGPRPYVRIRRRDGGGVEVEGSEVYSHDTIPAGLDRSMYLKAYESALRERGGLDVRVEKAATGPRVVVCFDLPEAEVVADVFQSVLADIRAARLRARTAHE